MGIKPPARGSVLLREVFRKRAFLNTLLHLRSLASFEPGVQQPCATIATVQQLRQGFVGQEKIAKLPDATFSGLSLTVHVFQAGR